MISDTSYKFRINSEESRAMSEKGRFYITFSTNTSANNNTLPDNLLFYSYATDKILNVVYENHSQITSNQLPATISVYNVLGEKVVNEQTINNGIYKYGLENGCYIIRLITNNKVYTRKVAF